MPVPELEAMNQVAEALEALSEQERSRVLRWAAEHYEVAFPKDFPRRRESVDEPDEDDEVEDEEDEGKAGGGSRSGGGGGSFEDFAELYHAVDPSTDPERVLVAAYWTQEVDDNASFGSTALNKMLKELGHGVGAINKAMTSNINMKPALILQVKRGGTSKQSRKTYKLTGAGVQWVKDRLA